MVVECARMPPPTQTLSWTDADRLAGELVERIRREHGRIDLPLWPIPRGGVFVAALLAPRGLTLVGEPHEAALAIDDIIDSGATAARVEREHGLRTLALLDRHAIPEDEYAWVVFPWEAATGGYAADAEAVVTRMIELVGDDAARDGLRDTPRRVVASWREQFAGYGTAAAGIDALLRAGPDPGDAPADAVAPLAVVRGIPFHSTCERHLQPFPGTVDVAYAPAAPALGADAIARVVDLLARRLTLRERLAREIAEALRRAPGVAAAGARVTATHHCMLVRGEPTENATLVSSAVAADPARVRDGELEALRTAVACALDRP